MTIDEAIQFHQKEEEIQNRLYESEWINEKDKLHCLEYAEHEKQLVEWLIELKKLKTTDVQPIVYAHKTINVGRRSYCSNCGELAIMENFCSKCGAKVEDGEHIDNR